MRGIVALSGPQSCLHGIKVGLLLKLANVFLVADSLVAKPVGDLAEKKTIYSSPFTLTVQQVQTQLNA